MTRFSAVFLFSRNHTRQARQSRPFWAAGIKTSAAVDAAAFAQRVRKRLGLTQLEFSRRIDVSLDTIRNWEQGKRSPTGAARALLRVLDKAPEASLEALR